MDSKATSCDLDPIPTKLLKENIDIILPVLTKMVNLSLQSGVFPDEWKLALVIPLIKKLGLELIYQSYRPVSNLPFISKVVERAVIDQDTVHMQNNCPLPVDSSAYRQGHSTESALLKVHSDILANMESQKVTLLVLIDLSAAFDTVDHNIALTRLNTKFGISGTALKWHQSYLCGRQQCVFIDGIRSKVSDLHYGVPQGSCLGPVLFTQYASTLFDVIYRHLDHAHGYADDHQLYMAFSPNSLQSQESAIKCMEVCLNEVKLWMLSNKLKMNNDKTEFLIVGSRQQLDKIAFNSIKVGDSTVTAVDNVRDLGAYLDSNLTINKHIEVKCSSAFRALYSLRRIRRYLSREATETLVHSFIFSHLDYCNGLLYGVSDYLIEKMQRIQNMAARLIFCKPKFSHVSPLLFDLHWLPVKYRIRYKLILFTFKGIHRLAPEYICDMFQVRPNSYSHRSSTSIDDINFRNGEIDGEIASQNIVTLIVPRTKRVTFEARSLVAAGPYLWNTLPHVLRCETDVNVFKSLLKTHLFKIAHNV